MAIGQLLCSPLPFWAVEPSLCPLHKGVIEYAKLHEQELKEQAMEEVTLVLMNSSMEADLLPKFLRGAEEHGAIDPLMDFTKEAKNEAIDLFWYKALRSYLLNAK